MVLFAILGLIVLMTFIILGSLFYMLGKEGKKQEEKAVPVTDVEQIRKEFSAPGPSPIISSYEPKVSLPLQEARLPEEALASEESEVYKKRAQELEDELKTISQKAQSQSLEAKQMIETLSRENETLKSQQKDLEGAQERLKDLEKEASVLKTDNTTLQTQLELSSAKVRLLEEEMTAVKFQMGEEINRAHTIVEELKREKEQLSLAPKLEPDTGLQAEIEGLKAENILLKERLGDLDRAHAIIEELKSEKEQLLAIAQVHPDEGLRCELEGLKSENILLKERLEDLERINVALVEELRREKEQLPLVPEPQPDESLRLELEGLKTENEQLKQKLEDGDRTYQKLHGLNDHLIEKNNLLQQELIKARAQSSGLERISFNYKNQLEDTFKRISAVEREYEALKAKTST